MYASAMKFCGAMELCGIGYPTNEPVDYHWPQILEQVKAQNAGVLFAITRGHKPAEAQFCLDKGFTAVYQFTNPRTGTVATIWLKDFTNNGEWQTKIPEWLNTALTGLTIPAAVQPPLAPPLQWELDEPVLLRYNAPVAEASTPSADGPPF